MKRKGILYAREDSCKIVYGRKIGEGDHLGGMKDGREGLLKGRWGNDERG
jgi:hypothetical protein